MNARKTLIIATRNKGKIKEIREILNGPPACEEGMPFKIKSLIDLGVDIDIEETGKSFEENAILKAKTIGEKTGFWTLGEDSGLEVDALGGRPGILSARYAPGSDMDRVNKLLKELDGVAKEKRTARFRCVIGLFIPFRHSGKRSASRITSSVNDSGQARMTTRGSIITFDGVSEGFITDYPKGTNGFGYDPIFFNPDIGKTNAEVSLEAKNMVSHRARALEKCKKYLLSLLQ